MLGMRNNYMEVDLRIHLEWNRLSKFLKERK